MIFIGRKGKYQLTDKIGNGGEGVVYNIQNCKGSVAKIYKDDKLQAKRDELERKLKTMTTSVRVNSIVNGFLKVAWPQDLLYDEKGRFAGFVMPKVSATHKIYHIQQDEQHRLKLFPQYTWKYAIQYAYNLTWIISYLHMNDIVVGDMNMNNIVVDMNGHVTLIDCDSFDITDPVTKERFCCEVGMPELLAPEIQAYQKISEANFTKESDNFSLAIHIFRLLMMNADPFCAKLVGKNVDSVAAFDTNRSILDGESPFFRKLKNKVIPPWAPPLDLLPDEIINAFRRTFYYNQTTIVSNMKKRTTSHEWNKLLFDYAQAEPNPKLTTCPKHHVYSAHRAKCPFCEINGKNNSIFKF